MAFPRQLAIALVVCVGVGCGLRDSGPSSDAVPDGTLLVVDRREDRVLVVDAATGATRTVRPPGLAKCGPGLHAVGGRMVYVGSTSRASTAYSVDLHRRARATKLGGAHEVVPSSTPGRVWLSKVARCRNVTRLGEVQEMTVGGRVTARSRGSVPGYMLVGPVDGGVVMAGPRDLVAWDPVTGAVRWRHKWVHVLGTGGNTVAWGDYDDNESSGRLQLTDIRTGRTRSVTPPPGWSLRGTYDGALSPDGAWLAVDATRGRRRSLALVDVDTGSAEIVPGSRVAGDYPAIAWSPSGWVFFNAGRGRLMGYRPGASGAVRLPVRLEHGVFQMAAG